MNFCNSRELGNKNDVAVLLVTVLVCLYAIGTVLNPTGVAYAQSNTTPEPLNPTMTVTPSPAKLLSGTPTVEKTSLSNQDVLKELDLLREDLRKVAIKATLSIIGGLVGVMIALVALLTGVRKSRNMVMPPSIEEISTQLSSLRNQIQALQGQLQDGRRPKNLLEKRIAQLEARTSELDSAILQTEAAIEERRSHESISSDAVQQLKQLIQALQPLRSDIKNLEHRASVMDEVVTTTNHLAKEIKKIQQQQNRIDRLGQDLDRIQYDLSQLTQLAGRQGQPEPMHISHRTSQSEIQDRTELELLLDVYNKYRGGEKYVSVAHLVDGLVEAGEASSEKQALEMIDRLARHYPQAIRMGRERGSRGNYLAIFFDELKGD